MPDLLPQLPADQRALLHNDPVLPELFFERRLCDLPPKLFLGQQSLRIFTR